MNYSRENNNKKRKTNKSRKKQVKNKVGIMIFRIFIATTLIGCFAAGGALVGAYMGVIENAPRLSELAPQEGNFTTIIYSEATGEEVDRLDGGENREYASKEEIPRRLKDAFIAIEDERFYDHDGVDVKGLFRALYNNFVSKTKQGASTITQQLIKNKLGYKNNTWDTKLQEQYLAIEFEKNLTETLKGKQAAKDYILEQYLNIVGLGEGQVGVKAGAQRFFNKELGELTIAECATLAAITQNPTWRSPIRDPESNKKRQMATLDKMLELEMITKGEYDTAIAEDVYSKISKVNQETIEAASFHSYYTDAMINQVIDDLVEKYDIDRVEASNRVYTGGYSIYSAEDSRIQKIVDEAFLDESLFPQSEFEIAVTYLLDVKNTVTGEQTHYDKTTVVQTQAEAEAFAETIKDEFVGKSDEIVAEALYAIPQPQAAFVLMDQYTGQVKAIAGGRGPKLTNRGLNRATQSKRQPGSVFKVLASFAPALDMGLITPATVIDDSPVKFPEYDNYSPKNWYPGFRGPKTVRLAIRDSMNVITVKNMHNTGVENCMNYLANFGFTTLGPTDHVLAACLGGIDGIYQTEVAAAYAAIANGGMYNKPIFYTKVLDHNRNIILENELQPKQVLKKTTAYLLTNIMQDVITSGTGIKARFKGMHIAGKTGTTTGTKDLTLVGYTPYYTASIWLGYDKPKDMKAKTEGVHSLLWKHIMEQVHEGLEDKEFERPEGINSAKICTLSGLLATDLCVDTARTELFATGTQPTSYCDSHKTYSVCLESGKLANEFCPPELVQIRTVTDNAPANADTESEEETPDSGVPQAALEGQICDIHTVNSAMPSHVNPDDGLLMPPDNGSGIVFPSDSGLNEMSGVKPTPMPTHKPPQTQEPIIPNVPIIDDGPIIP